MRKGSLKIFEPRSFKRRKKESSDKRRVAYRRPMPLYEMNRYARKFNFLRIFIGEDDIATCGACFDRTSVTDYSALIKNTEDWIALVGISIFECRRENPQTFLIHYTGINRKYRNRGLGKGLKAASLMQLRRDFPNIRYMVTGNEETNVPMLKINLAMGFTVRTEFTMLRYQEVI